MCRRSAGEFAEHLHRQGARLCSRRLRAGLRSHREPRITRLQGETVGAGDFIPPATWRGMGARLETVKTDFDVYMLGKVLWCMVAGKPKLDREFWDEPENDLTKLFPSDPHMHMI